MRKSAPLEEQAKGKRQTMKKLMIAAAVAAMIGGAQAVTCVTTKVCTKDECTGEKTCVEVSGAGTAHKVVISLKTTQLKSKNKRNKSDCTDDCTYWREQATKKINGLLWEQLNDCEGCVPFGMNSAFWTKDQALDLEFGIGVGLIGKDVKSKKIEAYGGLDGEEFGHLAWAGFGDMAGSTKTVNCADECVMYVKKISGGIAGWLVPAEWDATCQDCYPIVYEGCCDDMQFADKTAAYGTIKITYDAATAKKVAVADNDQDVASFFKLPASVADEIADVVNEVTIEE
jgi:hypothetical protein